MRHGYAGRQLGRDTTARKALFRGLAMQLIEHGQIVTTLPKAKDLRRVVEPMITRAREDNLANRRLLAKEVTTPAVLKKLFEDVAPMFKNVQGGYTRVLKMGFRKGDDAPMALIQLTKQAEAKTEAAKPAKAKAKKAAKAEVVAETAEAKAE